MPARRALLFAEQKFATTANIEHVPDGISFILFGMSYRRRQCRPCNRLVEPLQTPQFILA
jgi:hypothetical protein